LLYQTNPGQGGVTPLKGNEHHSKFLLTHREREVFELLVQDKTTRDIAGLLFISEKTVRNHISNVMQFEKPSNIIQIGVRWFFY
jgi:LuxR family transcriptional regulator of spore coat protein